MCLLLNSLLVCHYYHPYNNSAGIGVIVKKEPKKSEFPPHLKEEPHSPEVKPKMTTEERGYEKVEEVVPAEKMRQLQLAYKQLSYKHEQLKEKMEYIIGSQSEFSEAIGKIKYIPIYQPHSQASPRQLIFIRSKKKEGFTPYEKSWGVEPGNEAINL